MLLNAKNRYIIASITGKRPIFGRMDVDLKKYNIKNLCQTEADY